MPTTVQVSPATRKRLIANKEHPRQPYDEVINEALDLLEEANREFTPAFRREIKAGRADVRAGRVYTTKLLLKELGL
jgi:predicted transcriptional regulator